MRRAGVEELIDELKAIIYGLETGKISAAIVCLNDIDCIEQSLNHYISESRVLAKQYVLKLRLREDGE